MQAPPPPTGMMPSVAFICACAGRVMLQYEQRSSGGMNDKRANPRLGELAIEYVMLDFNGTAALDGKLKKDVKDVIDKISRYVKVFIITADTYETADAELSASSVTFIKVGKNASGEEKAKVVRGWAPRR